MHCYLCEQEIERNTQKSTYYTLPDDDSYFLYKIVREYHFCKACSDVFVGMFQIVKDLRELVKQQ